MERITARVNWGKNTKETREKLKEEYNNEKNKQTLKQHLQRKLAKAIEVKNVISYTLEEEEEEGEALWVNFTIEYEDEIEREKTGATNKHLSRAKHAKNDEFYTLYDDVEYELKHYHEQLKGQTIYLPCDSAEYSNFWKYLVINYNTIKYKKIICTSLSLYNDVKTTFNGTETKTVSHPSGKFQDNIDIFKEADIVITNPPFSTAGEFTKILLDNNLKYLFIGPLTLTLREHNFEALKTGKMKAIDTTIKRFVNPEGEIKAVAALWYTNLERKEFEIKRDNDESSAPLYYDTNIPFLKRLADLYHWKDYHDVVSVPVTIFQNIDKFNVDIIRIIGNSEYKKASEHPHLKKFLRGKEVTNNLIPPLIKNERPRENQHYWVDQNTGEKYTQPFARILVKWRK